MRLSYLSHRRPAKAQASLRIRAVSPEPSLFAHMTYGCRRRVQPKSRTASPTGWLCMCVWRMILRRTKSTIISWAGSCTKIVQFLRASPLSTKHTQLYIHRIHCTHQNHIGGLTTGAKNKLSQLMGKGYLSHRWNSEGSGEPSHPHSVNRTSTFRSHN